jgi:hypothetical protein
MRGDKITYKPAILEVANYLFENPDKKMSEVIAYFVVRLNKNPRSIQRYISTAREYNKERIKIDEKIFKKTVVEARERAKESFFSREKILNELEGNYATLTKVVDEMQKVKEFDEDYLTAQQKIITATEGKNKILKQVAEMEGYDAPLKIAETDSTGSDKIEEIKIKIENYEIEADGSEF